MPYDNSKDLTQLSAEEKAKALIHIYKPYEGGKTLPPKTIKFLLGGICLSNLNEAIAVSNKAYKELKREKSNWLGDDGKVYRKNSSPGKGLIIEHTIPIDYLHKEFSKRLTQTPKPSVKEVANLIKKFCKIALITSDEDKKLNKKKLRQSMPKGWNFETGSITARYQECSIDMHE